MGGTTYNYHYLGDQLVEMAWGANRMHFTYDAVGPLSVNFNGSEYFYLKNAQGDVTGLVDSTGAKVVAYTYGPWGEVWSVGGTLSSTLGTLNPLRYRGYVYDAETGLYYLNSRYYNPTWGRFINADAAIGQIGNAQGMNMFSYCLNNPVNMDDPAGNWPKLSTIFAVVAIVAVAVAVAAATVASCGAAAPALALAGGSIISGISSGATAIAAGALLVAGASATASGASKAVEKKADRNSKRNNTVYKLVDKNDKVQYVGRTTNVTARAEAHKHNPFRKDLRMEIIAQDLGYNEARGLEQIAMLQCHTINTANRMNNQINGISPFNKSLGIYMAAGRGVAEYLGNQISNEILYWTGN